MKNNLFKKSVSVFLAVLMVMSCWVFAPEVHEHLEAEAATIGAPAVGGTYTSGGVGAYGTPIYSDSYSDSPDNNVSRWFKFINGDDWTTVYYPANIYLDVTETLQSAGYYFNVKWHFGDGTKYRILLGSCIWGDHSQWTGKPDGYYTMNNIFSDYSVDASLPKGYPSGLYGHTSSATDYDLRIVGNGYDSDQGTDGFTVNSVRHTEYVLFRSNQTTNEATIYLKGTPNSSYKGQTVSYSTSGASMGSYGLAQNYNSGWKTHDNATAQFTSKDDRTQSSYYEGNWKEMQWNVTIYDKQALNNAITKSNSIYSQNEVYANYITTGLDNYVAQHQAAPVLLKTRATNQTALDNQTTALENAAEALRFAASNAELLTAISQAEAILNSNAYTKASKEAVRTAYNAAVNSSYANGVTSYSLDFSDSSTWNAGQKADNDQKAIDNLTSALNAAIAAAENRKFDVTYENMFFFTDWAESASSVIGTPNKGTMTFDVNAGTITVNNNGANTQSNPNDHYTAHGFGNGHYNMTLVPGETYTFEYTTSGGSGDQVHIFFYDDNGNAVENKANGGSPFAHAYGTGRGTHTISFTAPENATKASFRFGSTVLGDSITFSDIFMYSHTRGDYADIANWTYRPNREVFVYNQPLGTTLDVPERTGYTFDGWWVDSINANGIKDEDEQVTDAEGNVVSTLQNFGIVQNWNLYSEWTENTYKIEFNANGGSGTKEGITDIRYTEEKALTANTQITRPGYKFTGWNTASDGTGTAIADAATVSKLSAENGATVTLYAQWELNQCTITFKFADGTTTSSVVNIGDTPVAPANTAAKNDAEGHHTYSWPEIVVADGNKTYEEIKTTKDHDFSGAVKANDDYTHSFMCTACDVYGPAVSCSAYYGDTYINVTGGENGTHKQQCSVCQQYSAEAAHTWDNGYVSKNPSCSEMGEKTYTCTANGCDATKTAPLDMTAHTWTEKSGVVKTAGTCTTEAVYYYGCADCDAIANDEVENGTYEGEKDATKHTGEANVVNGAIVKTCTTDGYTGDTYWSCCDTLAVQGTTIPAGHEWGSWNSYDSLTHARICSECGETEKGKHSFTIDPQQRAAAAGSSSVYHDFKCEYCEARGANVLGTNTAGIGEECFGTGATYSEIDENNHTVTCLCGRTKEASHWWNVTSEVEATCTTPGSKTSECTYCEAVKTETLPAGHKAGTAVEEDRVEATCTTDGSYNLVVRCTVCNEEISSEAKTIPAAGHTFSDVTEANAATCLAAGNVAYKQCTVCNLYYAENAAVDSTDGKADTSTFVIAQLDHSYTGAIKSDDNGKEATHSFKCVNGCNEYGGAVAHTWNSGEVTTSATCITGGTKTYTCTAEGCGATYTEAIVAAGHKFGDVTAANPATCIATGNEAYKTCTVCNKFFAADAEADSTEAKDSADDFTTKIDSTNHVNTTYHTQEDATCLAVGYTAGTYCNDCKTWISGHEEIPAIAHKNKEHHVKVPATCIDEGTIEYWSCPDCGKNFSDEACTTEVTDLTIKKLDHSYTGAIKSDGNGKDATHSFKCVNGCNEYGGAVAHTWNSGEVTTSATCITGGTKTYTCTAEGCGATYTEAIVAAGHKFGDVTEANAATCIATGNEAYKTCTVCNKFFAADAEADSTEAKDSADDFTTKIDSTNHVNTTAHTQEDATCLDKGYTAGTYCEDCKTWISGHEEIPAIAHKNKVHHEKVNATCIDEGTIEYWSCPDCGKNFSDEACTTEVTDLTIAIDADNHTKLVKTDAVAETCEEDGNIDYWTCEGCKKIYSDAAATTEITEEETIVAAKGHSYGDATCDKPATCEVCGATTGGVLGHDWADTTYNFAADGKTCTAQRVCKNDASHVENATATITSAVKEKATCETDGWTTYTATFTEDWATAQTLDVQDIPAINHDWEETTYNFAADGKTCTAQRVCKNDASHVENATATITSAVKEKATCETDGWTTYTATFTEDWATAQTLDVQDIPAINHDWEETTYNFAADGKTCTATRVCANDASHNVTVDATITSEVTDPATCEGMGTTTYTATFDADWAETKTKDVVDIPAKNHDWAETTYDFAADGSSCTAERVCKRADCGEKETAIATITSAVKTPATCTVDGWTTYTATFTENWATAQTLDVQDIPATDHDWDKTKSEDNLTRPELVDGVWTKGYYTYTCKNDSNHTTTEEVDRAEYTGYETARDNLEALLGTDITDEAKQAIEDILEENEVADNLIESEQDILKDAEDALEYAFDQYKGSLNTYTVTFVVEGVEVSEVDVVSGGSATAPADPTKAYDAVYHYEFAGWDNAFTNVTDDVTVTAQFTEIAHTYTHTDKDDTYHTDSCDCGYSVDVKHTETSAVTTKASCFADGVRTYTCTVCGGTRTEVIAKREHVYKDNGVETAATCKAEGVMNTICSNVETDTHEACTHESTRVIPVDPDAHKWETEYTVDEKASCDKTGSKSYHCEYCDTINTESVVEIAKREHNIVDTTVAQAPTCTVPGIMNQECNNAASDEYEACDYETTRVIPVDEDNHINIVTDKAVESTCYSTGLTEGSHCGDCGDVIVAQTETEKKAHTPAEAVIENEVDSSCYTEGSYDEVVYCSVCKAAGKTEVLSRETKTIEKKAHTPAEAVVENEVDSSCYAEGSYDEVVYCSVCKAAGKTEVLSRETKTIEKKAHTPAEAVIENEVDSSCYAEGSYDEVVYCSVCKAAGKTEVLSRETKTIEKKAHTPAEAVIENNIEADCENGGSYDTVVYCSVEECRYEISRVETEVGALGHNYTEFVETVENGCTTDGYDIYKCSRCDATTKKNIIAAAHTLVQVAAKAPTCTETGWNAYEYCTKCDYTTYVAIPAKGHDYEAVVTAPTCTDGGYTTYTCSCGDSYVADETPAAGHAWGEWIGEGDCTTTVVLTRTCSVCGKTETKEVSGNSHSAPLDDNGNPIYDNIKEADCTNGRFVYYKCTVCGAEVVEKGEALGHDIVTERVEPTCTRNGYIHEKCTRCGEYNVKTTLEKLGHSWIAKPDKAPTCDENGYENHVVCLTCGEEHYDVVSKTGHADNDGDGMCDKCNHNIRSGDCGCFCHSNNWFIHIIYSIIRFIWKVFGVHRVCVCDAMHY